MALGREQTTSCSLSIVASPPASGVRNNELFNSPDADIIVRSSDNVDFLLHKKQLEFATGAFPPAKFTSDTAELDILRVAESASILEIIFQFCYLRRFPSISIQHLVFESLVLLVEAADKYEVFSLINSRQLYICLRDCIPSHPRSVLQLAAKYRHLELIKDIAPSLVHLPLAELVDILPSPIFKYWSLYREQWFSRLIDMLSGVPYYNHACNTGPSRSFAHRTLLYQLKKGEQPASKMANALSTSACPNCHEIAEVWRAKVAEVEASMPPLDLPLDF
ncbi:hypothetical protein D9757_010050 [Collybiopsis confluens]|uniref:BTB domain-containing protein n=1 Tax=Collybiopsis confluens TaxID=2823264 RepID=A0A8H5GZE1_9AGAR|nr:hypothetical protein D9757_010050 [Collybiopsis confluens]